MDFIRQLSESKLFPSNTSYKQYTGLQISEMIYLHIVSLGILAQEPDIARFSKDYAQRCMRYSGFAKWYQNATDLHLLLHVLDSDDVVLRKDEASHAFLDGLYYNEPLIKQWFKSISSGHADNTTHRLFITLDTQFKIKDSSMKSVRRLAQDWYDLSRREKQLCLTRLLQIMRVKCPRSDLMPHLEWLAKQEHLELKDVCDLETGEGCGLSSGGQSTSKKKSGWLPKVAAAAVGGYIGYKMTKPHDVQEDADAGVTSAADIAPVASVLGTVKKRSS